VPPPHQLGIMGSAVISPEGSGAKPRRPRGFLWIFGTQAVILGDSIIQSQCKNAMLYIILYSNKYK